MNRRKKNVDYNTNCLRLDFIYFSKRMQWFARMTKKNLNSWNRRQIRHFNRFSIYAKNLTWKKDFYLSEASTHSCMWFKILIFAKCILIICYELIWRTPFWNVIFHVFQKALDLEFKMFVSTILATTVLIYVYNVATMKSVQCLLFFLYFFYSHINSFRHYLFFCTSVFIDIFINCWLLIHARYIDNFNVHNVHTYLYECL